MTPATSTYTVPAGVTAVTVTAWGAEGTAGSAGGTPGTGGGITSVLAVTPGQVLELVTGSKGGSASVGGTGGQWGSSGAGGTESDVRVGACATTQTCGLTDRVVVAGAGGGTAGGSGPAGGGFYIECGGNGGAAVDGSGANGCARGDAGISWPGGGRGGTPTAGGAGGPASGYYGGGAGSAGSSGLGGNGANGQSPGGAGGDGYFGGGGGAEGVGQNIPGGGGGGGSSWAIATALSTNFLGAGRTGDGSVTVTPVAASIPSSTALVLTPATAEATASVTFTATVSPSGSAGTVAFTANSASISGCGAVAVVAGVASCTTSYATVGARTIGAIFSGTGTVLPSTATSATETITQATTASSVVSSLNPVTAGAPTTYTATVTPVPTSGTFTFEDSSVAIGACTGVGVNTATGTATCTIIYPSSGSHSITVVFSGDTNYATSTSPVLAQVVLGTATTTTLTSDANPSGIGGGMTFRATVSPAPTAGTMKFTSDGTTITGCGTASVSSTTGLASCTISYATTGTRTIVAVFSGSTDYATSTSSSLSQVVNSGASQYTNSAQYYTVPSGVTAITVTAWGAAGSAGSAGGTAGSGGGVTSTIAVTPGQVLEVVTGAQGGGGGSGGGGGQYGSSGSGGGASDIRVGACAATLSCGLTDRVVVAGAGGGTAGGSGPAGQGYYIECGGNGGAGADGSGFNGCARGDAGISWPGGGRGATATAGGAGGPSSGYYGGAGGSAGGSGVGGNGASGVSPGGPGGDGYFGGGGGAVGVGMNIPGGGGGGGSSWASPTLLSSSFLGAGHAGNGSVTISHTASQVVLSESVTTSIVFGATRVLTATIEDSAGTVVDTGADSTLSITFATASGAGTVSGLGSATAVAGIATITVTGTGVGTLGVTAASAAFTSSPLSLTVIAASQSISFSQPTTPATYGTAFTVTPTATSGLGVTVQASGGCADVASGSGWTVTMTSGTTDCTLTATQAGNTSYNAATSVVSTVSAAKAAQRALTLTGVSSGIYGNTYTITAAGGSGSGVVAFSESGAACQIDSSTSSTVTVEIIHGTGSCTVTVTKASDLNYSLGWISHLVAPLQRRLSVNATSTSKTYGDSDPTLSWTLVGFASTDTASNSGITGAASCSRTGGEKATIDLLTCAAGTLAAPNYSFATGATASFTIMPAPLDITASDASMVYGNVAPTITPQYLGLKNGDSAPSTPPTCDTTATPTSDVSQYSSTCHDATDSNYSITYTAGTVTITKADQTVTFAQPASPAVFGDVFAVSPTASSGLAVTVTASGGCSVTADGASWNVTMTSGTVDCALTVAQAGDGNFTAADSVERTVGASQAAQDAVVTAAPASATYGDTAAVDVSGGSGTGTWAFALAPGSACSVSSTTATEAQVLMTAGVGSCEVDITHAADGNYLESSTSVSITATKRTLTIDATDANKTYGAEDPQLDYALNGFINGEGDAVVGGSATCSRAAGEVVGSYAITCVPATLSATDYSFATGTIGQLVIGQADLTITASDASIHFGDATPVIAPIYSGLAQGDSAPSGAPTCRTAVTAASSPGVYASTCQGASDANYSISYVAGSVTILKAAQSLTFVAPVAAATFGTSFTVDPTTTSPLATTLVATGGCSADPTASGWTITMTSGTDTCVLTASQAGDANFEAATDVTLTISAQLADESPLTVIAPTSGVYGTSVAVTASGGSGTGGLSYSASGSCISVAAGDSVQLTAGSGLCTVTVTRAADADYRAATSTVSITALPALLKVNAIAASKTEGDPDPTFGWTLTGFIGHDGASVVSGTADCTRPAGETAGSYAVSCAPGSLHASNYSFATGASASLTIAAAALPAPTPTPTATPIPTSTPTSTPTPTPASTDSAGGTGTSGSGSKSTTSGGGKAGAFSLTAFVLPAGIVLLVLVLGGGSILMVRRRRGV